MQLLTSNMEENYYASYDFSPDFYVQLCKKGFIATSCYDAKNRVLLLPEMQFEYAVLDFNNLHISKKVNQLLKKANFTFTKNSYFEEVISSLETYHNNCWLTPAYKQMLFELKKQHYENFEIVSFELSNSLNSCLIAAEIGYIIGKTYTSLSGFCTRKKEYNNWGKLQLVLLALHLQKEEFDFWNLGHACLQYKLDLGAVVYPRESFLQRWNHSIKE